MTAESPQRPANHRTDTRAVRAFLSLLPDDLIIRGLDDTDYGIDLRIELFQGEEPTGNIAWVQVKGTTKTFDSTKEESYQLSKKTITYAQKFQAPFFLIYASVPDPKTSQWKPEIRFVWLQKYLEVTDYDPNEKGDSKAIRCPVENVLTETSASMQKFVKIIMDQTRHREALEVMKIATYFYRNVEGFLEGQTKSYLNFGKRLCGITEFFREFNDGGKSEFFNPDVIYAKLIDWDRKLKEEPIPKQPENAPKEKIDEYAKRLKEFTDFLNESFEIPLNTYAAEGFVHKFQAEQGGTLPY